MTDQVTFPNEATELTVTLSATDGADREAERTLQVTVAAPSTEQ
jgi:hypothetical protein